MLTVGLKKKFKWLLVQGNYQNNYKQMSTEKQHLIRRHKERAPCGTLLLLDDDAD